MLSRPDLVTCHTVATEGQCPQVGTAGGHKANVDLATVASIAEEPQMGQVRSDSLKDRDYVLELDSSDHKGLELRKVLQMNQ